MKDNTSIVKMGIFLMVVGVISALALSATHGFTEPIIETQRQEQLQKKLHAAVPDADEFSLQDEGEKDSLYVGYSGDEVVGYAVVINEGGYANDITTVIGLDTDYRVASPVQILDHEETPGLGSRIEEAEFREQFVGKSSDDPLQLDEDIDGLAGATISTNAVISAVHSAIGYMEDFLGETVTVDLEHTEDGTHVGTGRGFGGDIDVEVKIEDGRLISVEVVQHDETPDIAGPAIEEIPVIMVDEQEIYVDAKAGATYTTEGIISAVEDALVGMGMDDPDFDLSEIPDGLYRGQGAGYAGSIEVIVEVEDGQLRSINVVDHYEIDPEFREVLDEIPQTMLEEQDIAVDAYTGATETTFGIVEAVSQALEEIEDLEIDQVPDGTYTGKGVGYAGSITVEVEIAEGEFSDIEVVDHYEIPSDVRAVLQVVPERMLEEQDVSVDAYSGATETTLGIVEAVRETLDNAIKEMEDLSEVNIPDGTYTTSSEGYGGDMEIEVEFKDGNIEDVRVLEHEETPDVGEPAISDIIEQIKERESLDIDTYSGATVTSEAILEAIRDLVIEEQNNHDNGG